MKYFLSFLLALIPLAASGAAVPNLPAVLRQPFTTNSAGIITNMVRQIGTNATHHAAKMLPGGTLSPLNGANLTNLNTGVFSAAGAISANSVIGTDAGKNLVSYSEGTGIVISGGVISADVTLAATTNAAISVLQRQSYASIAEMKASTRTNLYAEVDSYWGTNVIGGGRFEWEAGTATIDDGIVFAATGVGTGRWRRILDSTKVVNLGWFGVWPIISQVTLHDSSREWTNALTALPDGGKLVVPAMIYGVKDIWLTTRSGITIEGENSLFGPFTSTGPSIGYLGSGGTNSAVFHVIDGDSITFRGLCIQTDTPVAPYTNSAQIGIEFDQNQFPWTQITTDCLVENCHFISQVSPNTNWVGIYFTRLSGQNVEFMTVLGCSFSGGGSGTPDFDGGTAIRMGPSQNALGYYFDDLVISHCAKGIFMENGSFHARGVNGTGGNILFDLKGWAGPIVIEDCRMEIGNQFARLALPGVGGGSSTVMIRNSFIDTLNTLTNVATVEVNGSARLLMTGIDWQADAPGFTKVFSVAPGSTASLDLRDSALPNSVRTNYGFAEFLILDVANNSPLYERTQIPADLWTIDSVGDTNALLYAWDSPSKAITLNPTNARVQIGNQGATTAANLAVYEPGASVAVIFGDTTLRDRFRVFGSGNTSTFGLQAASTSEAQMYLYNAGVQLDFTASGSYSQTRYYGGQWRIMNGTSGLLALTLGTDQSATFTSLAGSGTRMVMAGAGGLLSAQIGGALAYDGSANNGNLATSVDTLQELNDAVDNLSLGGGGLDPRIVSSGGTMTAGSNTFAAPVFQSSSLTASTVIGTDGGKNLVSYAAGSGINISGGTISATGGGSSETGMRTNQFTTNVVGQAIVGNVGIGGSLSVTGLVHTLQAGSANTLVVTNGRVGIGTASPESTVEIRSAAPIFTLDASDATDTAMRFQKGNTSLWSIYSLSSDNSFRLYSHLLPGYVMTTTTAGNVGIGNIAPAAKLDVTGNIKMTATDVAATIPTNQNALVLTNATLAANGAPQNSPGLSFKSHGWNSSISADYPMSFTIFDVPTSTAGTPTHTLTFSQSVSNGAATSPMTLKDDGTLTTLGGITAGGVVKAAAGNTLGWLNRAYMSSPGITRIGMFTSTDGGAQVEMGTAFITNGVTTTGGYTNKTVSWLAGTGSPEAAVVAAIGSIWSRTDGSTDTAVYRKETGTGNTGWVADSAGGGSGDVTAAANFGTDNRLIRSDGTGKGVQASEITVSDIGVVTGVNSLAITNQLFGATNGTILLRQDSDVSLFAPDGATKGIQIAPTALTLYSPDTSAAQIALAGSTITLAGDFGTVNFGDALAILTRVSAQYDSTDTTLGTVTGLSATVASGGTYRFYAQLNCTIDATGGGKYAIGGTATATAIVYRVRHLGASLECVSSAKQTSLGSSVSSTAALTDDDVIIEGVISVDAGGTLVVQMAQAVDSGTSSVLVGSTFSVVKLP